mmetsp:Transcript_58971/g.175446  ORF Transcript_58971/g.175446 Transcript_58971/m.175446 type:complete len:168 (-) Transcript_58971:70-573(-)
MCWRGGCQALAAIPLAAMGRTALACLLAALGTSHVSSSEGTCLGSEKAACSCLLSCDVFGGDDSQCHGDRDPDTVVDEVVRLSLNDTGTECDGIGCVVACSKELGCLDHQIKEKCRNLKQEFPKCKADCNAGQRGASPSTSCALLLALAALLPGILAVSTGATMGTR